MMDLLLDHTKLENVIDNDINMNMGGGLNGQMMLGGLEGGLSSESTPMHLMNQPTPNGGDLFGSTTPVYGAGMFSTYGGPGGTGGYLSPGGAFSPGGGLSPGTFFLRYVTLVYFILE